MKALAESMTKFLPKPFVETAFVRLFGLTQIPLLWYIRPSVLEFDSKRCVVKVPLMRRTKNHLGSMYFGVLCAAADCAGGLVAMRQIQESGKKVALSFKDFHAEFHKRAEGDVLFINEEGEEIRAFVEEVISSGERMNKPVTINAYVPSKFGNEPVATFVLTLSLKLK
jgi:acyl-coenzyme A thioesterase PaaI-like protein